MNRKPTSGGRGRTGADKPAKRGPSSGTRKASSPRPFESDRKTTSRQPLRDEGDRPRFGKDGKSPSKGKFGDKGKPGDAPKYSEKGKSFDKEKSGNRGKTFEKPRSFEQRSFDSDRPSSARRTPREEDDRPRFNPDGKSSSKGKYGDKGKSFDKPKFGDKGKSFDRGGFGKGKPFGRPKPAAKKPKTAPDENTPIRLNKFIANSGVCSRREADVLISTGVVSVNGEIVTELGRKVTPMDVVKYDGHTIRPEKKQYVLLNKPKNFLTTMDDPMGRKTVMSLVKNSTKERIFPVGRLDRSTTGLLLFTNDGDLAKRLMHPSHGIRKIYHVTTREKVSPDHLDQIRNGIELEDGPIKADDISYVGKGEDHHEIGIEIHSGRNRIVRRIFEHFGYTITKLDRVFFAGLTKKDLPRGEWRHLSREEVNFLYMNS
ncbi:MAG: hypothetical protein RL226_2367 [Bacteroidota bacterium]